MIEWNQSQEDRARTQRASSALKSSLLTDLQQNDPENVNIDILQDEDTDVPLNTLLQIRRDYESDIKPEITIQTVYDPSSNKNMILSIDKNTGEIWPGPVHFNEGTGWMAGPRHTDADHPILTRVTLPNPKIVEL